MRSAALQIAVPRAITWPFVSVPADAGAGGGDARGERGDREDRSTATCFIVHPPLVDVAPGSLPGRAGTSAALAILARSLRAIFWRQLARASDGNATAAVATLGTVSIRRLLREHGDPLLAVAIGAVYVAEWLVRVGRARSASRARSSRLAFARSLVFRRRAAAARRCSPASP